MDKVTEKQEEAITKIIEKIEWEAYKQAFYETFGIRLDDKR